MPASKREAETESKRKIGRPSWKPPDNAVNYMTIGKSHKSQSLVCSTSPDAFLFQIKFKPHFDFILHADCSTRDANRDNAKRGLAEGVFPLYSGCSVSGGRYFKRNSHGLCSVAYRELTIDNESIVSALSAPYTRGSEEDGREFLSQQDVGIHLLLIFCAIRCTVFWIENGDFAGRKRELG